MGFKPVYHSWTKLCVCHQTQNLHSVRTQRRIQLTLRKGQWAPTRLERRHFQQGHVWRSADAQWSKAHLPCFRVRANIVSAAVEALKRKRSDMRSRCCCFYVAAAERLRGDCGATAERLQSDFRVTAGRLLQSVGTICGICPILCCFKEQMFINRVCPQTSIWFLVLDSQRTLRRAPESWTFSKLQTLFKATTGLSLTRR